MRDYRAMVVSNPGVMMGKPVIAGTRITVESILERVAAGETVEQILGAQSAAPQGCRSDSACVCGWRPPRRCHLPS